MNPESGGETQIPRERDLDEDLGVGGSNPPPPTNLFPNSTPSFLVDHMLDLAEIVPGLTLLEPSAGSGAIANAAAVRGAIVTCVELNVELVSKLFQNGHSILHADFLRIPDYRLGLFDRVVMNPPRNAVPHIRRAIEFLKPNGILVALHRMDATWIETLEPTTVYPIPDNTFAQEGQPVRSRIIVIRK